jgi:hypothetical protein
LVTADGLPGNDNRPLPHRADSTAAEVAERFRQLTGWLALASTIIAVLLLIGEKVPLNPDGSAAIELVLAAVLLASRIWWRRTGHERLADASGTIGLVSLGGMACGAIAMLELKLHFPLTDKMLRSFDLSLGIDGIAVVDALVRSGHWIFWIMAPAYNFTVPLFFASLGSSRCSATGLKPGAQLSASSEPS